MRALLTITTLLMTALTWAQPSYADVPGACRELSSRPKDDSWEQLNCTPASGTRGTEGRGQLVILFHGFINCPWEMKHIAETLCQRGYEVEVTRLSGHGGNASDLSSTTKEDLMETARQKVYDATTRFGGQKAILGGTSLGGLVASTLITQIPDRTRALFTLAPFFDSSQTGLHTLACSEVVPWVTLVDHPSSDASRRFWYTSVPSSFICEIHQLAGYTRGRDHLINQPRMLITTAADDVVDNAAALRAMRAGGSSGLTYFSFDDDTCGDANGCVMHQLAPRYSRANRRWDQMMSLINDFVDANNN